MVCAYKYMHARPSTWRHKVKEDFLVRSVDSKGGQAGVVVVGQALVQDPPLDPDRKLELVLDVDLEPISRISFSRN
jgi:hypothetical protein